MKIIKDLLFEMKNPNYELAKTAEEQIVIEFEDLLEQANKLEKQLADSQDHIHSEFCSSKDTHHLLCAEAKESILIWQEFKKSQGIE